ncbi:MAG TPA: glycoside hydrolase family 3 N-terminal domain-containing protein [Rectinemataceae bacterium]|nr:glycoside hydrolase family 3 N-terminal domain-containing protein [Rectinemataceae bacterium]
MRSPRFFLAAILGGVLGCALMAGDPGSIPLAASAPSIQARAREILAGMSLEEKAGQVLLVGVGGRGFAPASSLAMVKKVAPGGILLFGFNVPPNPVEISPALQAFQKAAASSGADLPLLVAIDHEGGSVFRFKGGITRPPAPLVTARRGPAYAKLLGEREGLELGDLGITMVLGPVVEPLTADNQAFLGDRSYGRDPRLVDRIAGAYIEGLAAGGAIAVAKHFPADGPADPHRSLPRLAVPMEELRNLYLSRFAAAIKEGVPVIMISHIVVEAVDPGRPATLSPKVEGMLRKELGFKGVALTDDLLMKALGMSVRISAPRALAAGADLLMLSAEDAAIPVRDALVAAVKTGTLTEGRLDEAAFRVIALKLAYAAIAEKAGSPDGMKASPTFAPGSAARLDSFVERVADSARLLDAASRSPR